MNEYLNAYSKEAKFRAVLIDTVYRAAGGRVDIWDITITVDKLLKS